MKKLLILLLTIIVLTGCGKDDKPSVPGTTPYNFVIPLHFPQELNIPSDNPLTVEGIELGRNLFYDGRLSGRDNPDSMMCCATCHVQAHSFVCGVDNPAFPGGHPHGLTGIQTNHITMPLMNLIWNNTGYLWNGSVCENDPVNKNIEDIVWLTVVAPDEIYGDTNRTKNVIGSIPGYRELFKKAFGSETVTMKNISRAIAQFVRTLVSADSKFDRFLKGEIQLSPQELNGYVLFMTEEGADCFHCHGGEGNPLFSTGLFYNNGKDTVFTDLHDRFHYSENLNDAGSYKAPSLRNLIFRAPYMHDGRFTTIDQVIDFYSSGIRYSPVISPLMHHVSTGGVQLTPSEKQNLKAFLLTLTDSSFVTRPDFAAPAQLPQEK